MHSRYSTFVFLIVVTIFSGCSLPSFSLLPERGPLKEVSLQGTGDRKVLVIDIDGVISDQPRQHLLQSRPSMVQEVVAQLQRAESDGNIKAVLLKINSPGGSVTASDILYHEISEFKKRTGVHIVVAMMNLAASGGYYVSLPADWIMAHPTTVTGSIGVIFARPQVSGFMDKLGLAMEVNTSGEQKDMGSPFRPPTDTEKAIFQELTDEMAKRFHDLVATHRTLNPSQMEQVATARVFLAHDAKKLGLVDQIGYLNDALDKAKALAGLPDNASVVTYRRRQSADDTIYNPSGSLPYDGINAMMTILTPLSTGGETGFYYIWPAAFRQ